MARTLVLLNAFLILTARAVPAQQRSERCAIYQAAIAEAADTERAIVVDSTTLRSPMFAFMGMVTFGRTNIDSLRPLPDSALKNLGSINEQREPLRDCVAPPAAPVSIDSLRPLFAASNAEGWHRFHARYPGVTRFIMVSKPLALDDSTVIVYAAYAAGWRNGAGFILKLRRDASGRWVRRARALFWLA